MKRILGWGIAVAFGALTMAGAARANERTIEASGPWPARWTDKWCQPWFDPDGEFTNQKIRLRVETRFDRRRERLRQLEAQLQAAEERASRRREAEAAAQRELESENWATQQAETRQHDTWYSWREPEQQSTWYSWREPQRDTRRHRTAERRRYRHDDYRDDWRDSRAGVDVSLMGGMMSLKRNHDVFYDNVYSAPATLMLGLDVNRAFALEGEFTVSVPVRQTIEISPATEAERKGPNLLLYQAGFRVGSPTGAWTPYIGAGGGLATVLMNAEPNRYPQVDRSQTIPAANIGAGAMVRMNEMVSLRLDFRQIALFPTSTTTGIASNGSTNPIWLHRGSLGFTYGY